MMFEKLEGLLAYHAAPTLMGLKPANLISTDCPRADVSRFSVYFNNKMRFRNIEIRLLCACKSRTLFLVFNRHMLLDALTQEDARQLMLEGGYTVGGSLDAYIDKLSQRLSCNKDFPHEIGVFLGYPIEDINGFIAHRGERFKLCGYWKVYNDEVKAKQIFKSYDKCRSFLCGKIDEGVNIYKALC